MSLRTCWCGGATAMSAVDPPKDICLESVYHDPFSDGRPKSVRTLYVAGPMTGYPQNNYPEFHRIATRLRDAGYLVVNPAEFGSDKGHYVDLLRQDLIGLLECDGVAFHGDWWESSGARNEVTVAGLLRMPVRSWQEWLERSRIELPASARAL